MPEIPCPHTLPDGEPCSYKTLDLGEGAADATVRLLEAHVRAAHPVNQPAKQEKAKLPSLLISAAGIVTEAALGMFKQQLASYKRLAGLTHSMSGDTVLQGLPQEAYSALYRRFGDALTQKTESQILTDIEDLLVRPENRLAQVMKLMRLKQEPGQTVPIFSASLRAAARTCNFNVKCECQKTCSYEDEMVLFTLLAGLEDTDVQADLLAKPKITLDAAEQYAKDKEMAKRSQEALASGASEELARLKSSYQKLKADKLQQAREDRHAQQSDPPSAKCGNCGEAAHVDRKKECKAYSKMCTCGRKGHLPEVCRSKGKPPPRPRRQETAALLEDDPSEDSLFAISNAKQRGSISAIFYDRSSRQWREKERSKNDKLEIAISLDSDSLQQFRPDVNATGTPSATSPVRKQSTPDTGASVMCAGASLLQDLGVAKSILIKSDLRLYAANRQRLTVLGCLPCNINIAGRSETVKEMVYVVKELTTIFLSKHALMSLGCISSSFPHPPGRAESLSQVTSDQMPATATTDCEPEVQPSHGMADSERAPCGCLKRTPTPDPPKTNIPMTEENVPALTKLLLDHYASSAFNTCGHQPPPLMKSSPPLEIHLRPDATPHAVYTPVNVPVHFRDAIKKGLDRDVELGILEKVDVNEPVEWCAQMCITRKHNGEPRRTVDMRKLNEATIRQPNPSDSPYNQAMTIPSDWWKTCLDAWEGFSQVPLRESDWPLTTFITPWGRYRYRVATQGSNIAGDGYTHRFDKVTADVVDVRRQIDDSALFKPTIDEMFTHTASYLTLCGSHGIIQNPDKFQFCKKEVDWAGFRLGPEGVKPLPKHTDAVRSFPVPENVTDLRSFMQLVNQVSHFYAAQPKLLPFRELLKKNTTWYWDETLTTLFTNTKEIIASEIERGIKSFSLNKPVALLTDWSKTGMGHVLTQKHCTCSGPLTPLCCKDGW